MKNNRKFLTDKDINSMAKMPIAPDDAAARRKIVAELGIKRRMNARPTPPLAPDSWESARIYVEDRILTLDLHRKTEEQAWDLASALFRQNPGRRVRVITGASGILRVKFMDWITRGLLSDYINEWVSLNRGAFEIRLRK